MRSGNVHLGRTVFLEKRASGKDAKKHLVAWVAFENRIYRRGDVYVILIQRFCKIFWASYSIAVRFASLYDRHNSARQLI